MHINEHENRAKNTRSEEKIESWYFFLLLCLVPTRFCTFLMKISYRVRLWRSHNPTIFLPAFFYLPPRFHHGRRFVLFLSFTVIFSIYSRFILQLIIIRSFPLIFFLHSVYSVIRAILVLVFSNPFPYFPDSIRFEAVYISLKVKLYSEK